LIARIKSAPRISPEASPATIPIRKVAMDSLVYWVSIDKSRYRVIKQEV
jgi:hypothetical protein